MDYQDGTYQEVVEANLLLFQEDEYGEGVAADAENSEYEHEEACTIYGGQRGRGAGLTNCEAIETSKTPFGRNGDPRSQ